MNPPGVPLHVVVRGDPAAPPVLLLHGFTGSAEAWGDAVLEPLARRARVLAVDLPGHGESAAPHHPDAYRMDRVLAALHDVLDRHGIDRADWIGYSMGGRIALAAAVRRPERVHRLVLESARPGLPTAEERAARRDRDEDLAHRLESEGIGWFVDHWMKLPLFESQRRLSDEVRAGARARRLALDPRALAACLRGLGTGSQPSFVDDLPRVGAPVLLITGEQDPLYVEIARGMAALFPDAVHHTVPEAGHTVHLEAPAAWVEAVERFLSRPEASASSRARARGPRPRRP